ncbi:hypothetical protein D915_005704 [Fasciola hepatica]|uniref:Sodium channel and clathrin linker 1 n=1 Tax=Fasciola hepatica TaxID=6192 RepID=A0A4E0RAF8_FASHE|nr:hypothetical protein D915_005704 [Fasciola hepatica]
MEFSASSHADTRDILEEVQDEVDKVRLMKDEVESLGKEVKKLLRNRNEQPAVNIYQNKCFQNLEAQLDTLKEELQTEAALRTKVENELKVALEDLEFYKNANKSDAEERRIREIRQHYELLLTQGRFNLMRESGSPNQDGGDNGQEIEDKCSHQGEILRMEQFYHEDQEKLEQKYLDAVHHIKKLEKDFSELQERYSASCLMAKESFQKVSESIELAKTAADERDAATLAQSNTEQELNRLQKVIEKLVDEAGQRTAEEVEKVREQANLNISKLLEELHAVEQERTKLEHELECLKSAQGTGNICEDIQWGKLDPHLESTMQRAHWAEQQRDELKLRLESAETSFERNLSAKQAEIQKLQEEVKCLKERLEYAEAQRSAMEDRFKHQLEALSAAENQALEAKRQANAAQRSALQQVLLANQTVELQDAESKRRLQAMEKANQTSVQRWQEMLAKQHTLAAQWRSEAEHLAEQMEQQGIALRGAVEKEKSRSSQLTKRLAELERKRSVEIEKYQQNLKTAANLFSDGL